jgi:hypothetical protein
MKRRCSGTASSTGEQCRLPPIRGGTVCHKHGGSAPQVKAAAARRVAEAEVLTVYERYSANGDSSAVDVAAELLRMVTRLTRFADFATGRIEALSAEQWRTFSTRTQAEVGMFQASCRDAGRLLTDIAKLGVLERIAAVQARISEAQGARLHASISAILQDLGVDPRDPAVRQIAADRLTEMVEGMNAAADAV